MQLNENNGLYAPGKSFDKAKWLSIMEVYERELSSHGECSITKLARLCSISWPSAEKAIKFYNERKIEIKPRGHAVNEVLDLGYN